MKKIVVVGIVLILCAIGFVLGCKYYKSYQIKHAKIEVTLKDDLKVEFNSVVRVKDLITSINGVVIGNNIIDTKEVGKKKVTFTFLNNDKIKVEYSFDIEVVDTVKPPIYLNDIYYVKKGSKDTLKERILCADDTDDNPTCELIGKYDLNKVGDYLLTYNVKDKSGNSNTKDFILRVYDAKEQQEVKTYQKYTDIYKKYKTKENKVGLDVSKYQGEIDFDKLKDVEFLFVRVGTKINGEYILDAFYKRNVEKANEKGIPVGVYFFSYAGNEKEAKEDALWVLKQIKEDNITLGVAFDFEDWANYNSYHMSFNSLTKNAVSFMDEVEREGYEGILYSSKNYLERYWLKVDNPIWLAHYTDKTNYSGDYKYWQLCDDALISGIAGPVDVDIMYP